MLFQCRSAPYTCALAGKMCKLKISTDAAEAELQASCLSAYSAETAADSGPLPQALGADLALRLGTLAHLLAASDEGLLLNGLDALSPGPAGLEELGAASTEDLQAFLRGSLPAVPRLGKQAWSLLVKIYPPR